MARRPVKDIENEILRDWDKLPSDQKRLEADAWHFAMDNSSRYGLYGPNYLNILKGVALLVQRRQTEIGEPLAMLKAR
jgi:hypothetical protein